MRVKISANPPLPPVRAWFPLAVQSTPTVSSFKSLLCTSLPAFRGVSPSSLRLFIDGFELLDNSELSVVRDGDLVCVDVLDAPSSEDERNRGTLQPTASRKRKRRPSTPSSSSSESGTTESTTSASESESDTSDSESTSDSDEPPRPPLRKAESPKIHARERARVQPKPDASTFVPPGRGKPQTRARNLRRRLQRMHGREDADVPLDGRVSGADAVGGQAGAITGESSGDGRSGLLSLSLRNKNKAKNFRSLIGKPLAPKIIFGDQEGDASTAGALPRLIPPSSRSSLPPNVFVTSIDVEAGMRREKKKRDAHEEQGGDVVLDYGDALPEAERLEAIADKDWAGLEKLTSEGQVTRGTVVGHKGLGIDPVTCTPEERLTVGRVVSCDGRGVVVRPLREVSFGGPVDPDEAREEAVEWRDIVGGDWRLIN